MVSLLLGFLHRLCHAMRREKRQHFGDVSPRHFVQTGVSHVGRVRRQPRGEGGATRHVVGVGPGGDGVDWWSEL
jgi:hypothetical protein